MAKPPAFQLYARDWLAGDSRQMTLEEKGAFIDLLCYAWLEEGIPDDPARIARILGVGTREFNRLWPAIAPCWEADQERGKLVNARQEGYRGELDAYRAERSESGRRGAEKRWRKEGRDADTG